MTSKAQLKAMAVVEKEIIKALFDGTKFDLYTLKLEMGMDYLVYQHGYKEASKIWKDKRFWWWWRQTWHINDRKILNHMHQENAYGIYWNYYKELQEAQSTRFYLSEKELNKMTA